MKSFLKKTAISVLVMGMAGASTAAMSHTYNAWSPRLTGWFIGLDGIDMRPMNGDLDFATLHANSSLGNGFNEAFSPDYEWGWRLYGGIKFTDNDDLTLSWTTLDADDHGGVGIPGTSLSSTPRWMASEAWNSISGKVSFDLDDVYAVWGHTINFNNPWSIRYAAGLDYVRLDSDMIVNAEILNGSGAFGFTGNSHLRGFGPRVEFDATYHLPYNLAVFANTNVVLFASDRKLSLSANVNPLSDSNQQGMGFTTRHVVVPKLGMRLGASYGWMFGQAGAEGGSVTTLTIDAGWQVDSYIHAIERVSGNFNDESFTTTTVSNFSDQGVFVGLKLSSDWL